MGARQHERRAVIKGLGLGLTLALAWTGGGRAQATGPRLVIEALDAALLEVMQAAGELGYRGRNERLAPLLRASYDFPLMARIACGRAWRDWSAEERARITERFALMSIASYAARFSGYSGERFEITGEGEGPRGSVLVQTRLLRPDGDPVGLDYLLKESEGRWRIIDVLLDAKYSELARQRAEFGAVIEAGGAQALLATLDDKIAQLAAG